MSADTGNTSEAAQPPVYTVRFDRLGRNHDVPPLTVQANDADEIAFHVYQYARKYLASKDVACVVNLAEMRGSFNYGRFGSFTLTAGAA